MPLIPKSFIAEYKERFISDRFFSLSALRTVNFDVLSESAAIASKHSAAKHKAAIIMIIFFNDHPTRTIELYPYIGADGVDLAFLKVSAPCDFVAS